MFDQPRPNTLLIYVVQCKTYYTCYLIARIMHIPLKIEEKRRVCGKAHTGKQHYREKHWTRNWTVKNNWKYIWFWTSSIYYMRYSHLSICKRLRTSVQLEMKLSFEILSHFILFLSVFSNVLHISYVRWHCFDFPVTFVRTFNEK